MHATIFFLFCLLGFSEQVFAWQASNLLYVDQPVGTGFSYTSDDSDIRHDEEGVSNDLYDFLQVLIIPLHETHITSTTENHPQLLQFPM